MFNSVPQLLKAPLVLADHGAFSLIGFWVAMLAGGFLLGIGIVCGCFSMGMLLDWCENRKRKRNS